MTTRNTTIAAIATAPGEAGISIIRISGSDALRIADRVVACSGKPPSRRPDRSLLHGNVLSNGNIIDEAIVLIMRAPHSYTREDVVEIQAHGGIVSARRVLRAVLQNGASPAEPGEFTKRAFLNGRIDLPQAEAVLDLIRARSDRSAQSALEQLSGGLSSRLNPLYEKILALAAEIEAWLDFSEDDAVPDARPNLHAALASTASEIAALLATWEEGHVLRDGALVVISGKPNVGKSTLFNTFLGRDRAIVSDLPGTTRDTIEEALTLAGVPIRLVDTAGLRPPESEIESAGVRRAWEQIRHADAIVYVIDSSTMSDDNDIQDLATLDHSKTIVALNKSDLKPIAQPAARQPFTTVSISCVTGHGIKKLRDILVHKLGCRTDVPAQATISERHRLLLHEAASEINEAITLLRFNDDELMPIVAVRLKSATQRLGDILGKTFDDDILDSIFSRFCIGK